MIGFFRLASILVFASFFSSQSHAQQPGVNANNWVYDAIHIPVSEDVEFNENTVVVAVVDDAFRLSHKELKEFIYKNPLEIAGNQIDDDGNNYVDDVYGWDISDKDNDVSVLNGRGKVFFHGTYICSIITKVASIHYGQKASERIKIMPVKVISDHATKTYIKEGYKGIRYAMENGADIICVAWSGGNPGDADLDLIREAHQKGILIVGSVGNFNMQKILNPANASEVLAVAGVNMKGQKYYKSNYGSQVDISAPAEAVKGAHPDEDNAFIQIDGTSASTALVTSCAAILRSKKEGLSPSEIKEILLNTATPFDQQFSVYGGKMGSGIVNLENALNYISNSQNRDQLFSPLRPKGSIVIDAQTSLQSWDINPAGNYHGFHLNADISKIKKPEKQTLSITVRDTIWNEYSMARMPQHLFIPSKSVKLNLRNSTFRKNDLIRIHYHGLPVDSTKLYCSGIQYISDESGTVDDGSSHSNYANNCSCKWIITAPPGKRVKFTFEQMDTQANVDFVYIVDGTTAIPENFIAKFSGQNIPPVVISRTNEVLVWFVTDSFSTGKGWQFKYELFE